MFWSHGDSEGGCAKTLLLAPQGTALIWSGDIEHSGFPTTSGERCIFVAAFDSVPSERLEQRLEGDCTHASMLKDALKHFMRERPRDTGLIGLGHLTFTNEEADELKRERSGR